MDLIHGHATPAGTDQARGSQRPSDAHSMLDGLHLSSVGLATDQGDATDEVDAQYARTIGEALSAGVNVLDTANIFRNGRSERVIGAALRAAIQAGRVTREQVFIATKGGYIDAPGLPFVPKVGFHGGSYGVWFQAVQRDFIETELCGWGDIAQQGHCLLPRLIDWQLGRSRAALGVETIDLYNLHHPEVQLKSVVREVALDRIRAAFSELERHCSEGRLRYYGVETSEGLRVPPTETFAYLSLEKLIQLAEEVGGASHHFRAVAIPVGPSIPQALTQLTQPVKGSMLTAVEAARRLGLYVFASGSTHQPGFDFKYPDAFYDATRSLITDFQRVLQYVRSVPGVGTVFVGTMRRAEAREASLVMDIPRLTPEQIATLSIERELQA